MTVAEQASRKVIVGAGWANPLTSPYVVEQAAHVHVFADDVELVNGVDYTVTNVLNPAGYAVTITTPGSWAPTNWVLDARPPIDQGKDLTVGGTFGAKYEDGLDKLARRVERVYDIARRGLKTGLSVAVGDNPYTIPVPEANTFIGWNEAGDNLENFDPTGIGIALVDNDATLSSNSPTRIPSQRAVKAYVDAGPATAALQTNMRNRLSVGPYVADRTALAAIDTTKTTLAFLKENGREDWFEWTTGNLTAQITADPGQSAFVPTVGDITGASGAWARQNAETIRLKHLGAVPADIASASANASALRFAFDRCIADGSGVIEIPPKTWYMDSQILKDYSALGRANITLVGKGMRSSILRWTGTSGGIDLTMNGTVQVEDLGLFSDAAGTKSALRVNFRDAYPTILAKRLFIAGTGLGSDATCWAKGISINNPGGNSQLSECVIFGTSANRSAMASGIEYGSDIQGTQMRVERNLVTNADIGFSCITAGGIEGLHVINNDFVTVTNGVYIDFNTGAYRHPHFDISENHIQSFGGYSIFLRKVAQAFIEKNLIYGDTGTLIGIYAGDCEDLTIGANQVLMGAAQTAIALDNNTYNCTILPNTIGTTGTGITLNAATHDNKIHEQLYHSAVTTKISKAGTNNLMELSSAANPGYRQTFDMLEQWGSANTTLNVNGVGTIALPIAFADKNYSASVTIAEILTLQGYECRPSYTDMTASSFVFGLRKISDGTVSLASNATVRVQWKVTGLPG